MRGSPECLEICEAWPRQIALGRREIVAQARPARRVFASFIAFVPQTRSPSLSPEHYLTPGKAAHSLEYLQNGEEIMRPSKIVAVTSIVGPLLFAAPDLLFAKDITATEFSNSRSYSSAVSTEGGKIVWLAGEAVLKDESGKSLAGDFEGQTRAIFASIEKT